MYILIKHFEDKFNHVAAMEYKHDAALQANNPRKTMKTQFLVNSLLKLCLQSNLLP